MTDKSHVTLSQGRPSAQNQPLNRPGGESKEAICPSLNSFWSPELSDQLAISSIRDRYGDASSTSHARRHDAAVRADSCGFRSMSSVKAHCLWPARIPCFMYNPIQFHNDNPSRNILHLLVARRLSREISRAANQSAFFFSLVRRSSRVLFRISHHPRLD